MGTKKLLFIVNPHSGKQLIKNHMLTIVDDMVKAGYSVMAYTTQGPEDAKDKVIEEAGNFDRIVCCGGDGTLDEVMTGLMISGIDTDIGYIPAGSTNDFANSLGLPKMMVRAAQRAIGGEPFPCDIGEFNDDTFVYIAAFGLFTEVSYQTSQQLKNIFGHVAYLMQSVKSLYDIASYNLRIECNGQTITDEFVYGMITNSTSVGGIKDMTGGDVKLDDGLFEITMIRMPKNPFELSEVLACLANMIADSKLIYSFKSDEVKIFSAEPVSWTLDGEYGGEHSEVVVRNLKQRVRILR
ncbi:MAG: YegS/Rv2252/BmrU family lipid kinase [Clostridiales bacterium]|nr:YegS/Rv2252/BmrU family lipid kinase [Clostridiales bacterium]